ncbi:MAG: hypothetical protein K0S61_2665 [Anaerocolumna sp.]|jgi:hypothetical protein|nr:hypothetical protein [Anaerocolumna sp.]
MMKLRRFRIYRETKAEYTVEYTEKLKQNIQSVGICIPN